MLTLEAIKIAIDNAKSVVIISHINPDGDTLGSGLALRRFLLNCGKQRVELLCDDEKYSKLDFLSEGCIKKDIADEIFDLAIGVDVANAERMGEVRRFYFRAKNRLVVDHHKSNEFDSGELFLRADSSSTAEIMYDILDFTNDVAIDKKTAEFLYAGILTDSGAFYFPSTSSNTHLVLSKLYGYGIDANRIYFELFKKTHFNVFKLHTKVLNNAKFYENNRIAILSFMKKDFEETSTEFSDTEGCINKIQDIDGLDIAISVAEVGENSYKISMRSKGEIDVSNACARFGGGGHKNAAGGRLSGNYYDIIDKLLRVAKEAL